MTTTWTLQNLSAESAESLNVKPFNRTAWAESGRESIPGGGLIVEHRVAGDSPTHPLVRRSINRPTQVFHPALGRSTAKRGRAIRVEVYSNVKVDDTVLGPMGHEIVEFAVEVKHTGATLPDYQDALQMLMSTLAELYDSVTTGTPDYTVMSRVATGSAELD